MFKPLATKCPWAIRRVFGTETIMKREREKLIDQVSEKKLAPVEVMELMEVKSERERERALRAVARRSGCDCAVLFFIESFFIYEKGLWGKCFM